jgi:predicted ATPase
MAYPDAWVYWIDENGIQRKPYKETPHYQIMLDFVNQPERMLDVLLGDE